MTDVVAINNEYSSSTTNDFPKEVIKRDGRTVYFDQTRIVLAIQKAMQACGEGDPTEDPFKIAEIVSSTLLQRGVRVPHIEEIQDIVEETLILQEYPKTAKAYILYRNERAKEREAEQKVPAHVQEIVDQSKGYFRNPLAEFVYFQMYARWIDSEKRRETWIESCQRYMDYMREILGDKLTDEEYAEIYEAIVSQEVMPSMRLLWSAGVAARHCHATAYNCSYLPIRSIEDFGEILYLLMCGCGVGFSVEAAAVQQLPIIKPQDPDAEIENYEVEDSREGWAKALIHGLHVWFDGRDILFDLSNLRGAGARLKTMGGRSCLTGDTIVYRDRKKPRGYNEVTVEELFKLKQIPYRFDQTKLRCLDEETGEFYRNNLVDVVYNGKAPVYEIVTEAGYRIKATENHRFLNEAGEYQKLELFNVDDLIAVNGAKEKKTGICVDCGEAISRRAIRCKGCFNIVQTKDDALGTTARQRIACRNALGRFCEDCGSTNNLIVHHDDENPLNNNDYNLITLCEECHRREHASRETFGDPYSHRYLSFDKIISITYIGIKRVYDLVMQAPDHNFVANGFVSHNSGPEPLRLLLNEVRRIIFSRQRQRLSSIDCHDIGCLVGYYAVMGGVRRAAEISISDLNDEEMRHAKTGHFFIERQFRAMANNSTAYNSKPSNTEFMEEWLSLAKSGTGERGIFNRGGLWSQVPSRRLKTIKDDFDLIGVNPCGEIILKPYEFCNLTNVICRSNDTAKTLKKKVRIASILGTYQSMLTDFNFLRPEWKANCDEERLLGVGLSGIWDCPEVQKVENMRWLKAITVDINKEYAERFGINPSVATTCIKPSGNSSQLVDCASGMHPRYAKYYIRRVRIAATDPLFHMLKEQGFPYVPEIGQTYDSATAFVLEFPIAAPKNSVTRHDLTAIEQLEFWKLLKEHFTEHNPSMTCYVKESEWLKVGMWVYDNWDIVGGLTFLPEGHVYTLAPYEEITEQQYNEMVENMPQIDFSKIMAYEKEDNTTGAKEFACFAGACEI